MSAEFWGPQTFKPTPDKTFMANAIKTVTLDCPIALVPRVDIPPQLGDAQIPIILIRRYDDLDKSGSNGLSIHLRYVPLSKIKDDDLWVMGSPEEKDALVSASSSGELAASWGNSALEPDMRTPKADVGILWSGKNKQVTAGGITNKTDISPQELIEMAFNGLTTHKIIIKGS